MRKRIGLGIGLLVLVWVVAAGIVGGMAGLEAKEGRDNATAISGGMNLASLQSGARDAEIVSATQHFGKAHDGFEHPVLWPARYIPWVGTQLNGARDLTAAAATTSEVSLEALQKVRALAAQEGLDRAELLRQAAVICIDADAKLRTVDLGSKDGLVGPLADARATAVEQLNTLDSALVRGGAASSGLHSLLTTNARYLLIAANNAEMRNGSGMFLQAGLLTTNNGNFDVGDMVTTGSLAENAKNGVVQWQGDIGTNWEWLGREGDMRNLMLSPRYDVNAPLAKEIWEKSGNPAVDGVITVDVEMMRALLAVVGPVSAGEFTINKDNAQKALLFDQYEGINYDTASARENADRREVLASVAALAFDKFSEGGWDLNSAAREFSSAAQGRHLLIWSTDVSLNEKWVKAGVGGTMTSGDTMVSLTNLGTNKLDQFMKVKTTLEAGKTADATNVTLTITITNEAPPDGPQYVLGPIAQSPAQEAEYLGMLTVSLPGDSKGIKFDGDLPLSVRGRDGDNAQVAVGVDALRGNSQTFVLRFSRPADALGTTVVPSAHLPAVDWTFGDQSWKDIAPKNVNF